MVKSKIRLSLIVVLITTIIINIKPYKVMTPSMADVIEPNDYILTKMKTCFSSYHSPQILAFNNNYKNDNTTYIKRAIASEGDTIFIKKQYFLVNGIKIPHDPIFEMMVEEPSQSDSATYYSAKHYSDYLISKSSKVKDKDKYIIDNGNAIIVPNDHYFMVGDNYYESMDSRFWGFIPRENIKGKVFSIFRNPFKNK